MIALRSQKVLIWWSVLFGLIYFAALAFCLHLLPTPSAQQSPAEIAQYYGEHSLLVRMGAALAALTGAFMMPWVVVLTTQLYRHEKLRDKADFPVWTVMAAANGALATVIIVIPTNFLGTAAYAPDRASDVTTALHELGILMWLSGDQWAIFFALSVAVVCLIPNSVKHSPFPRWYGYMAIIVAVGSSPSVVIYLTRTGPFAWNGLLGYWVPMMVFVFWFPAGMVLLYKAINAQMRELASVPPKVLSNV